MGVFTLTSRTKPKKPGLCAVSFLPDGIALAYIIRQPNQKPHLVFCRFIAAPMQTISPQKLLELLSGAVKTYQLQNVSCAWVLQPDDYRLVSMEPLPVPIEEMASALRWRIKEFIDYPVSEASVDFFPVPNVDGLQKNHLIYVVIAKTAYLKKQAQLLNASGLNLEIIDIADMALRNVCQLFPEDKKEGLGIIAFNSAGAKIILCHNGYLKLSRQIELTQIQASPEVDQTLMKLVEEMQRSFDYYENQLDQRPINKILITSSDYGFLAKLRQYFSIAIAELNIAPILGDNQPLDSQLQSVCLTAIGGALRDELDYDATAS